MDDVALIRERTDIIALLQEYIPLKKAGRNFKANCPFHNETTPSFMVSVERQMWHCFGCQKGGDAYTFLMEYEHMEFPEALRFLAKRAGVELHEGPRNSMLSSRKEKIYEINRLAASFYHYILTTHMAGKNAREYLAGRKINDGALKSFRIGFAPGSGDALVSYLVKKKGCSEEDIVESGLGIQRMGRLMDFFRDRIMFPLIDHRDNIVGFSGRVLVATTQGPKYINTKETPVYHKGEQFFGIEMAKDAMRTTDQAILVEGEFDVIACFQEGIRNVLAIKGTALTQAQVKLLSRYVKRVTMCLDDDSAGQEALVRSFPLLEAQDLVTSVLVIPEGKDPDEAIQRNAAGFKAALKHDVPVLDYLLEKMTKKVAVKEAGGKKELADFFLPLLSALHNEIIKEHYVKKLSSVLDTSSESLYRELGRFSNPKREQIVVPAVKEKLPREEVLEEYLVALLVQSENPVVHMKKVMSILSGIAPKERANQKILYLLADFVGERNRFSAQEAASFLPTELLPSFNTATLYPLAQFIDLEAYVKELKGVVSELRMLYLRHTLQSLSLRIEEMEKKEEPHEELLDEYRKIAALSDDKKANDSR